MFVGHNGAKIASESALVEVGGVAIHWSCYDLFSDHEQGFKVAGRKGMTQNQKILGLYQEY